MKIPQNDCTEGMEDATPAEWLILKQVCDEQNSCTFVVQFAVMTSCAEPLSSDYLVTYFQCLPGLKM